ncbi:hypothetical protein PLICRDRAFT_169820 [Plicaturopsis crispa FD-325 SS-3]|nr:hypothetical protein PLICRDRAFT_169820 [Plicaturopsis crispa FD-325 SS-3]
MSATATAKFQLNIPATLLSASPGLSALHASRFRSINTTDAALLDQTHCASCGVFDAGSTSSVRTARPKKRRRQSTSREMLKTCGVCGYETRMPLETGNAALFPRTKKTRHAATATASLSVPRSVVPSVAAATPATTMAPTPSQPSFPSPDRRSSSVNPADPGPRSGTRPKKKSGLQNMLARNREKAAAEQKGSKEGAPSSGLAAFLSGL